MYGQKPVPLFPLCMQLVSFLLSLEVGHASEQSFLAVLGVVILLQVVTEKPPLALPISV